MLSFLSKKGHPRLWKQLSVCERSCKQFHKNWCILLSISQKLDLSLFSDAYKDNFVAMDGVNEGDQDKVRGKAVRPNIECTDGYIHMVDTVMFDDTPPWAVIASKAANYSQKNCQIILLMVLLLLYFSGHAQ